MLRLKFGPTRDVLLLAGGFLLLGHETLFVNEPRWTLLLIATAMLGIPAALGADNLFARGAPQPPEPPQPQEETQSD